MNAKHALRKKITACLTALTPAERIERGRRAAERLRATTAYRSAKVMMAYVSFGTEFPTGALLGECLADGKTLGLPRAHAADCSLSIHAISNLDTDLERHALGFLQPLESCAVLPIEQLDLVVAPGVAFDDHGNRLGRGGGYYDRFLARPNLRAKICALAFECQIVDSIMVETHDRPMDLILTEDREILTGRGV